MTIEELKQVLEAATPGPWEIFETGTWPETNHFYGIGATKPGNGCYAVAAIEGWTKGEHPNARLIVEAVNNLPKLLKVAEERDALQARCDKLEANRNQVIQELIEKIGPKASVYSYNRYGGGAVELEWDCNVADWLKSQMEGE